MSLTVCRRFQRLLLRSIIVPVEASCRCSKHQASIKLCEVGNLEKSREETDTYPTGQFFLHKVLSYRGVILFPWTATIRERDPVIYPGEKSSTDDQSISSKATSKKHPYYTVLRDNRDAPYVAMSEVSIQLSDGADYRYKGSNDIKGLDYVAHEDIMPYKSTEATSIDHELFDKLYMPDSGLDYVAHEDIMPYKSTEATSIDHELFDKLFMPDSGNSRHYVPNKILQKAWKKINFPWSCSWNVYKETTENIRTTVIPFYMGFEKTIQTHWWGYIVRLENLGDYTVQLIEREWNIISHPTNTVVIRCRAAGVNGQHPVLAKRSGVFQYNSHVCLKGASGHMWGKYKMEREDQSQFDCVLPHFSLESKPEVIVPTEEPF